MRLARASQLFRTAVPAIALSLLAGCVDEPTSPATSAPGMPNAAIIAPPGFIRIGVVQESEELSIGGTGAYQIRDDVTGAVLLNGSASEAVVTIASVAVRRDFWRLQVSCSGKIFADDWVIRAAAAGYEPYTEFVPAANCYRLRVGRFPTRQAALDAQPLLRTQGLLGATTTGQAFAVTIFEGVTMFRAVLGSTTVDTPNPLRVVPLDGNVTIEGARYRGVGEVRLNSKGTLAGINELPIEEYLLGVVPRELGPIQYPYLEALKAQAVAARTYSIVNLGKRRNDGYDLLPTVSDQVYGGMVAEHPLSSQAVTETAGIVAAYNGKLISTLYSSTSGGWTANSEDVFTSAEPYLRGVPDHERGNSIDARFAQENQPSLANFRNHANARSLRNAAEGDFESDFASRHRWYVDWTPAEIRQSLSSYFGKDVGQVLEINVVERSSSGRALRTEFVTATGTYVETKDRLRTALRFVTSTGGTSSLYSTLVYIEPVIDSKTKELVGFEAWGGGFGHGVGMSQTGAVGMAAKGHTYDEILKHYYRGITLETR